MNGLVRCCLLLALVPALADAAPRRGKKPPKKTTTVKPVEPPVEPPPTPDAPAEPPKDAKTGTTPATVLEVFIKDPAPGAAQDFAGALATGLAALAEHTN